MPSQNSLDGRGAGRPGSARSSRYCSFGRVPGDARRRAARRSPSARCSTMTTSEIIATRSRRSRCQASCHGLRPSMLRGGVPGRREVGSSGRSRVTMRCRSCDSASARRARRSRCRGPRLAERSSPSAQRVQARGLVAGPVAERPGRAAGSVAAQSVAGLGAAGVEPAARRAGRRARAGRRRGRSRSRLSATSGSARGQRRQQRPGVGVPGPVEQLLGRCQLDDLAEVHHRDPVADVPHDRQVVGDEDVGQAELVLQVDRAG